MTDISSSSPSLPAIGNHQYHSSLYTIVSEPNNDWHFLLFSSPACCRWPPVPHLPSIIVSEIQYTVVLLQQCQYNTVQVQKYQYHSTYQYICTFPHISTIAPEPQYQSNISNSSNAVSCFLSIKNSSRCIVPEQYLYTTKRFIYSGITTVPVSQSSYLSAVTPMPVPQQYNSNTCTATQCCGCLSHGASITATISQICYIIGYSYT